MSLTVIGSSSAQASSTSLPAGTPSTSTSSLSNVHLRFLAVAREHSNLNPLVILEHMLKMTPGMPQQADNILVEEAQFYKQKKSPWHEFLIFLVKDRVNHGLKNYIALDRNVTVGSGGSFTVISSNNGTMPADDYFHISHNRDIEPLKQSCLRPGHACELIEKLYFGDIVFTMSQLVVLAHATSQSQPYYKAESYNCYWFSSTIWDVVLDLFRGSGLQPKVLRENQRGRFKRVVIAHRPQIGPILEKYRHNLHEFREYQSSFPQEHEPRGANQSEAPHSVADNPEKKRIKRERNENLASKGSSR
ncbi:hypothetical protein B0J17DRAFT_631808 [Rhizoctonia solani]|nr:hypothetical protein B0J17DRAFT_631808 [Rhizoctonia solani]